MLASGHPETTRKLVILHWFHSVWAALSLPWHRIMSAKASSSSPSSSSSSAGTAARLRASTDLASAAMGAMDREKLAKTLESEVTADPYRSLGTILFALEAFHRDDLLAVANKFVELSGLETDGHLGSQTDTELRKHLEFCARRIYKKSPAKLPDLAMYLLDFARNELVKTKA